MPLGSLCNFLYSSEPGLGPGIILGGVAVGGDGIIVVGRKIIHVSPRSPLFEILKQVATYEVSESIASVQLRDAVRRESLSAIVDLAKDQIQTMQVLRQSPPPLQRKERDERVQYKDQ